MGMKIWDYIEQILMTKVVRRTREIQIVFIFLSSVNCVVSSLINNVVKKQHKSHIRTLTKFVLLINENHQINFPPFTSHSKGIRGDQRYMLGLLQDSE